MTRTPLLATFPRTDAAFNRFVRATFERLSPDERDDPAAVQAALRRWHTRAIVRPREAIAGYDGPTWYVYRDGQAGIRSEEGWWHADGVAIARLGENEVFIDGDDEACRLVGRGPDGLRGLPWRELVPVEARDDDAEWLFGGLKDGRPVESVFDCPLPDGRRRVIEYHTNWVEDERVYLCRWRGLALIDADGRPAPD